MGEDIAEFVERHEEYRQFPYRCSANKLTIGIGRNIEDVGISREEALFLLFQDIDQCKQDLNSIFGRDFFESLDEPRQFVLIDMRFNLGRSDFRDFKKTIKAIKNRQFDIAADEMIDSLWYGQVKKRSKELVRIMREGRFLTKEELAEL